MCCYGNFSDIHNQFDTMISSERERAFLVAEMSVFSEDEFTEYWINGKRVVKCKSEVYIS
jgi:ABC-type thiamine transport system substrate-binding protein